MLPCLLPARLLKDVCLLLFAVEGLEESAVPCLERDLGAPTEAERDLCCSKDLEFFESPVFVLSFVFFVESFFFDLLVGKGGNAQS